jgi:hypothetical protein
LIQKKGRSDGKNTMRQEERNKEKMKRIINQRKWEREQIEKKKNEGGRKGFSEKFYNTFGNRFPGALKKLKMCQLCSKVRYKLAKSTSQKQCWNALLYFVYIVQFSVAHYKLLGRWHCPVWSMPDYDSTVQRFKCQGLFC